MRLSTSLALLAACSDYDLAKHVPAQEADSVCDADDAPVAEGVRVAADCVREAAVGSFNPVVEWQWNTNTGVPGYDDLMATPAVGDISGDGVPEVVFASFAGGAYTSAGAITAVSGDGAGELWSVAAGTYSSAGVALGDLDGDGVPEVCTAGTQYAVVCLDNLGNLKWAAGSELTYIGAPAIADLEGDGLAEVILGRQVFGSDGSPRWVGAAGVGYNLSFAADMDGDPELEVVAGNTVYDTDGTVLWTSDAFDGMAAVGDFDADDLAEVVTTGNGQLRLTDDTGGVLWSVDVPGGGGGPPTVSDFDGDGAPEIGVAGAYAYSVFEGDGTTRWSMPVQDWSSSVTGSAVFDFEGDGAAEVVYADEITLWVFDGSTGAVELAVEGHASGTLYEYPLIADVDADGSTEIILASNNYAFEGWNGITVIGDGSSSWMPSRPVWNQFAYSISNVNDDLSIPTTPDKNWLTWNSFRAGGSLEGPASWLPDLTVGELTECSDACESGEGSLWVPVSNRGLAAAEGVLLELISSRGAILQTGSIPRVESGETVMGGPFAFSQREWGSGVRVRVDGGNVIEECDEDNELAKAVPWPCD